MEKAIQGFNGLVQKYSLGILWFPLLRDENNAIKTSRACGL
jgi:hypothetical protein